MNLASHTFIGRQISRGVFPFKMRCAVIWGSLLPDFDRSTQPHREYNLLFRIYNSHNKIKTTENEYIRALNLGIMLHYICDYYCYAHKYNLPISHNIPHINYEIEMHNVLKTGKIDKLSIENNFENIMEYILYTKDFYDKKEGTITRDLKYITTINNEVLKSVLPYFKKN